MVQEFIVLRCFSCKTFQVHQVKKAKKWACKVCGEKQSIKKTYGCGSAPDCRKHVQKLNMLQGEMRQGLGDSGSSDEQGTDDSCQNTGQEDKYQLNDIDSNNQQAEDGLAESKWSRFMEVHDHVELETCEEQLWHGVAVTTERNVDGGGKRKRAIRQKKNSGSDFSKQFYKKRYRASAADGHGDIQSHDYPSKQSCTVTHGILDTKENNFCKPVRSERFKPLQQNMFVSQTSSWQNYTTNDMTAPTAMGNECLFDSSNDYNELDTSRMFTASSSIKSGSNAPKTRAIQSNLAMNQSKWSKFLHPSSTEYNNDFDQNKLNGKKSLPVTSNHSPLNIGQSISDSDEKFKCVFYDQNDRNREKQGGSVSSTGLPILGFVDHVKVVRVEQHSNRPDRSLFSTENELEDNWWEV